MPMLIRRIISLILVFVCGGLLAWAAIPNPRSSSINAIHLSEVNMFTGDQAGHVGLMEDRRVVLEWPESMRIGDQEQIILIFKIAEDGYGQSLPGTAEDIYLYDNLMAEGRFEIAGITVLPVNPIRESMPRGQTVNFKWQVNADRVGTYSGTVWVSLRFLPKDGSHASQEPVFVSNLEINTRNLLGMSATLVRLAGGLGLIVVLGLNIDLAIILMRRWSKREALEMKDIQDREDQ